jgi:hypothetical protein
MERKKRREGRSLEFINRKIWWLCFVYGLSASATADSLTRLIPITNNNGTLGLFIRAEPLSSCTPFVTCICRTRLVQMLCQYPSSMCSICTASFHGRFTKLWCVTTCLRAAQPSHPPHIHAVMPRTTSTRLPQYPSYHGTVLVLRILVFIQ